jgi:protoporphyrinogen oxidase
MARNVHIIGAGLAGLAAAVRLAKPGTNVVLHEATAYPGGRCRSYFDRTIGMAIDNGNHLVLSGNHAVLGFAQAIGSAGSGPVRGGSRLSISHPTSVDAADQ